MTDSGLLNFGIVKQKFSVRLYGDGILGLMWMLAELGVRVEMDHCEDRAFPEEPAFWFTWPFPESK